MGPTNRVGYLLQHVAFMLGRQSDQVLSEQLGIGLAQFKLLMALKWLPNVQQKQIADNLAQTEASISRQIKLLEEKGYITNIVNPENHREHIIRTTEKGDEVTQKAMELLRSFHAPTFEGMSGKQLKQLEEHLRLIHDRACLNDNQFACHHPWDKLQATK